MKKIIVICLAIFLMSSSGVWAQSAIEDLSVDQLYEKARNLAFEEENYEGARQYAYEALDRSPDYHEIRVFVARTFSWQEKYSRAEEELGYVLQKDPQNRPALLAQIDNKRWAGNHKSALQTVNKAVSYYSADAEFLMEKADLLKEVEHYDEAERIYKIILDNSPDNRQARKGLERLQKKVMKNEATVSYRHDSFQQDFDAWHFTGVRLMRQTDIGSFGGSVEYARRFGSDGVQFSLDAYPEFTDGLYGHLNIGYSDASIYPNYRLGTMLYKLLPADFEISLGFRYLDFEITQTDIYVFGLTKYLGSYMMTGQTFLMPDSEETSASINVLLRRYFGSSEAYLGVNAGFGSAPVEVEEIDRVRIQALDTWSAGIEGQYPLSDTLFIGANIGFDSSEYPNFNRERFSAKVNISYRF